MNPTVAKREFPYDRIIHGAGLLLLVAILIYGYWPSLTLPQSLIDEAAHISNGETLWKNLSTGNLGEALRGDVSARLRTFNPLFWLHSAILYRLTGESRPAYHAILLLELLATTLLLFQLPKLCRLKGWSATAGGFVAATILLMGEVPGWHGFQSLRCNWVRLHTADAPAALLTCLHFLLILEGRRRASNKRASWLCYGGAAATIWLAAMLKPVFAALFGPMVLLGIFLAFLRDPSWKRPLVAALAGSALFIVLFMLIRTFQTGVTAAGYGSDFVLTAGQITTATRFYASAFVQMLGPIVIAAVLACAIRIAFAYLQSRDLRESLSANWPQFYFLLCAIASMLAYLPWTHLLPRYMMVPTVCLAAFIGIEVCHLCQHFATKPTRASWMALGVGAMAAILLGPVGLAVAIAAFAVICPLRRWDGVISASALGMVLVGFLYLLCAGFVSFSCFRDDYIDQEKLQSVVLDFVVSETKEHRTFGVLGDASNEQIGSLAFFAKHLKSVDPVLTQVNERKDLTGKSFLIEAPGLCPAGLKEKLGPLSPVAVFTGIENSAFPKSFYEWRRTLLSGHPAFLTKVILNKDWIGYEAGS